MAQGPGTSVFDASNNIAVYWGQNSYGQGSGSLSQQRLSTYCANTDVDIIPMAFLVQITSGTGGEPVINVANQGNNCTLFEGTGLLDCPQIGEDITTCQQTYNKTILLSIGGATYTEGGFASEDAAMSAAELIWNTFGPPPSSNVQANLTSSYSQPSDFSTTVTEQGHLIGSQSGSSTFLALNYTASRTISSNQSIATNAFTNATDYNTTDYNASISTNATGAAFSTDVRTTLTPVTATTFETLTRSATATITTVITQTQKATISPRQTSAPSQLLRPFHNATVDGFDLDLESPVTHMQTFASHLRSLMDAAASSSPTAANSSSITQRSSGSINNTTSPQRQFYLTSAPQCPFPDAVLSPILNDPNITFDAVFVQFYNNYCGLQSFVPLSNSTANGTDTNTTTTTTTTTAAGGAGAAAVQKRQQQQQTNFNFETWSQWAKNTTAASSNTTNTKIFLGIPGGPTAAGSGYANVQALQDIVEYCQDFDNFGGVMIWDASQAEANEGFLAGVRSVVPK